MVVHLENLSQADQPLEPGHRIAAVLELGKVLVVHVPFVGDGAVRDLVARHQADEAIQVVRAGHI